MHRKNLKMLSLAIAAAMMMTPSVVGVSATALAKGTETVQEQEVNSELADELYESKSTDSMEQSKLQRLGVTSSDLMINLVEDTTLYNALLQLYNTETGEGLTDATFTYGKLSEYTGKLDFSSVSGAGSIQSIEGLGLAKNASSIDLSSLTGVTVIPKEEFQNCNFTEIIFPSSIEVIEDKALEQCHSLKELNLPDTLTTFGEQAFANCTALESVNVVKNGTVVKNTLPSALTTPGQQAFLNNTALTKITLPSYENGAIFQKATGIFSGCEKLEEITIGKGITTIPVSAFSGAGKTSEAGVTVIFEEGSQLDKILGSAFSSVVFNAEAKSLDLSACTKLTTISDSVFESAKNLSTVILPSELQNSSKTMSFGKNTFAKTELQALYAKGAVKENTVYLPDYVEAVGDGCFFGNTVMTAVSLSASLPAIPDYTFDGCTALSEVEQRQKEGNCAVKEIGDCAFRSTAITNTDFLLQMNNLEVIGYQQLETYGVAKTEKEKLEAKQKEVLSISLGGEDAQMTTDAQTHQKVNKNNKTYGSEVFTNCTKLEKVSIPSSVKSIGSRAFYFSVKQESVITSVEWQTAQDKTATERRIYSEAFHGNTKLASVVLPANLNTNETLYIDEYAFYGAESLTSVFAGSSKEANVFPATLQRLGAGAFYGCHSLGKNVTISNTETGECPEFGEAVFRDCYAVEEVSLPKKLTAIPNYLFYNASVKTLQLGTPESLTNIGELAFFGSQFETLDLSKYTALEEVGYCAFAMGDSVTYGNDIVYAYNYTETGAKLKKVILPDNMANEKTLYLNAGIFDRQSNLDTMKTSSRGEEGQIYIPDYMIETGQGVFGYTAVNKVVWQADTTGTNQWTNIPVMMFCGCTKIKNATDVLPTGTYLESIGQAAFIQSGVEVADLSKYTNLKLLGSGKAKNQNFAGVFQLCENLQSVKLPESEFTISLRAFKDCLFLGTKADSIDLGGATSLGEEAFMGCLLLTEIHFPDTLKEIGNKSFYECPLLQNVYFGKLEKIGNSAFYNCPVLSLTENGLPDTLKEIGSNAFEKCTEIGSVAFGPELTTIGASAFKNSGMTKVSFDQAKKLATINADAFSYTQITDFDIHDTKVIKINAILQGCQSLTKAKFGDEVLTIEDNALAGCPKLKNFEFASTTTVSKNVFYNKISGKITAEENDYKVTVSVNTPDKTVVPVGKSFLFPYYVNAKGTSNFDYILIGNPNDADDIDQYLKVSAKLNDGYYKKRQTNDQGNDFKITDEKYYEALSTAPTMKVAESNKEIDTIQIEGLKPSTDTIDFSIVCSIDFACSDKEVTIKAEKFSANYKLEIKEIPTHAELYTDNKCSIVIDNTKTNQLQATSSGRGSFECYYDIIPETDEMIPDNYNLVIETDNPDVLYPALTSYDKSNTIYTTKASTLNESTGKYTTNTNMKKFWLVAAGVGTANIKVYPEGCPEYAKTYTYDVNADIQNLALAVPEEYRYGASLGTSFSIVSSITNNFGKKVEGEELKNLEKYTNQKIVYESEDPEYVSVDSNGNVKVLKADPVGKQVKITATATTSIEGRTVTAYTYVNAKYPDVQFNQIVNDSKTGATVLVTMPSKTDLEGQVQYVKPKANTTAVTIPDTVTISGVKYKVTSISDKAFKNNKKVKSVKVNQYITEIGANTFAGCTNLTKITIPANVTRIGEKAFYKCKKLKTVSISSKSVLTDIGTSAFMNCSALTSITVPSKVTRIGTKAFYGCKKLKKITIKSTALRTVEASAFKGIYKKATIKVPKKNYKTYKTLLAGKGQAKTVKIKK